MKNFDAPRAWVQFAIFILQFSFFNFLVVSYGWSSSPAGPGKTVPAGPGRVVKAGPGKTIPAGRGRGHWRTYSTADGLAGDVVYTILRDREGFL